MKEVKLAEIAAPMVTRFMVVEQFADGYVNRFDSIFTSEAEARDGASRIAKWYRSRGDERHESSVFAIFPVVLPETTYEAEMAGMAESENSDCDVAEKRKVA